MIRRFQLLTVVWITEGEGIWLPRSAKRVSRSVHGVEKIVHLVIFAVSVASEKGDFSIILLFDPEKGDKARLDLEQAVLKAQRIATRLQKTVRRSVVEDATVVSSILEHVDGKLKEATTLLNLELARIRKRSIPKKRRLKE